MHQLAQALDSITSSGSARPSLDVATQRAALPHDMPSSPAAEVRPTGRGAIGADGRRTAIWASKRKLQAEAECEQKLRRNGSAGSGGLRASARRNSGGCSGVSPQKPAPDPEALARIEQGGQQHVPVSAVASHPTVRQPERKRACRDRGHCKPQAPRSLR